MWADYAKPFGHGPTCSRADIRKYCSLLRFYFVQLPSLYFRKLVKPAICKKTHLLAPIIDQRLKYKDYLAVYSKTEMRMTKRRGALDLELPCSKIFPTVGTRVGDVDDELAQLSCSSPDFKSDSLASSLRLRVG